jgi:hypothetical protein
MKLQLGTSQPTLADILCLCCHVHGLNGEGNGCHANKSIAYCNMSCFVGSSKTSSISALEVVMKFVTYYLMP